MKKIMFSDRYDLTQAVIDGHKTMTRRIIPNIPCFTYKENDVKKYGCIEDMEIRCGDTLMLKFRGNWYTAPSECQPKYKIGEAVAVAQSYNICGNDILIGWGHKTDIALLVFERHPGWHNKMFVRAGLMPHQIRITDIKVERLQDISDEDCLKEGLSILTDVEPMNGYFFYGYRNIKSCYNTPREAFAALIDNVSGKGTWEKNPYVFAYSFELIKWVYSGSYDKGYEQGAIDTMEGKVKFETTTEYKIIEKQ